MSIVEYNTKGMLSDYEKARQNIRDAWLYIRLEKLESCWYDRESEIIAIADDLRSKSIEKMIEEIEVLQNL